MSIDKIESSSSTLFHRRISKGGFFFLTLALLMHTLLPLILALAGLAAVKGLPDGFFAERLLGPKDFGNKPVSLQLLSQQRVLVLEKNGRIRLASTASVPAVLSSSDYLTIPNVDFWGEVSVVVPYPSTPCGLPLLQRLAGTTTRILVDSVS